MDETRIKVRQAAERRLGLREHSCQELRAWLLQRLGAEEGVSVLVEEVIESLVSQGLLSDQRYARMMARHHAQRGKGPAYVMARLRDKGVRVERVQVRAWMAEVTLGAEPDAVVDPEVAELEQARRIIERRYPSHRLDRKVRARAFQALLRRGFSLEIARKSLEKS